MKLITAFLLLATADSVGQTQSGPSISANGYVSPLDQYLAPNQITTLFVSGLSSPPPILAQANGFPLPTSLSGFSVLLREYSNVDPVPLPILGVRRVMDWLAAITVQIPRISVPAPASPPDPNRQWELVVAQNGVPGPALKYAPVYDRIQILTTCGPFHAKDEAPRVTGPCLYAVTHADGKLVTYASNPPHVGETLVAYAAGLGVTPPGVVLGQASPSSPTPIMGFNLYFDFNINAAPREPGPGMAVGSPVFVGLTPGAVGVYQINFIVPDLPQGAPSCPGSVPGITSNLTVTLGGTTSFDGFQLCVQR